MGEDKDLLEFSSEVLTVCDTYSGKSKFLFWHDIEVGDSLLVYVDFKKAIYWGRFDKEITFVVKNLRTGEEFASPIRTLHERYFSKMKLMGKDSKKIYY